MNNSHWKDAFNRRPSRERFLLCGSVLALLFLGWSLIIQGPIDNRISAAQQELDTFLESAKKKTEQLVSATTALSANPVRIKQKELERIKDKVADVDERLASMSNGLVPASQLSQALSELLAHIDGLSVVSVKTRPAQMLPLSDYVSDSDQNTGGLYKHAVIIRLNIDYQQTLSLVKAIEQLPWKFYWESLDYRVDAYPDAYVEIQVYMLSSEEGRLGV